MIRILAEQVGAPRALRFSRALLLRVSAIFSKHLPLVHGTVHLAFVDEQEIRRLNRMYRGKDVVTDVLSFPSGDAAISGMLGDVLICGTQAERQAADGDVHGECIDLLVHGILHVLGYDHESAADAELMFPLQDGIVDEVLIG